MSSLPRHIAIVMDGNGRWARQRHLPRIAGHRAGADSVREVLRYAIEQGIEVLTVFAFSTENWQRPKQEVKALMDLFLYSLQKELKQLNENQIRLKFIGDYHAFDAKLVDWIEKTQALTKNHTRLTFVIAVNYGGRWDILQAAKKAFAQAQANGLDFNALTEADLSKYLSSADLPDPDLLIRTSGEQRISNFLNWQLSYTEFYFTQTLWPDFREADFLAALAYFANRERRYGMTVFEGK
jgi:undecaprenyl diphosphate synthase